MNKFASSAITESSMTYTENGHSVASTTGSKVLDLYSVVGALRGADSDRIINLFKEAISDDKLLAARTMFYARDVRGVGTGERRLFKILLHYAAIDHPEMVKPNLYLIPEFGRWDDLYTLVGTPLEKDAFHLMHEQYLADIQCILDDTPQHMSLLSKWLKSCNASSDETRRLGRLTAQYFHMSEQYYRKSLRRLRDAIKIVETTMSQNRWSDIEYDKIPSRAGLIYREAFKKHDSERYDQYIKDVASGKKTINASMNTPQDLVHILMSRGYVVEDETVEAMWNNLPNYVGTDENILVMADTSGSMTGRPMEVSTSLAMYFAQRNHGDFHNLFMTFESDPHFVHLSDDASLYQNLRTTLNADWGGSTDLTGAFHKILRMAKENHIPQEDMPTRFIIISDMEFDEANRYGYGLAKNNLNIQNLKNMYQSAGYTMPQIIYWNVDSRDNHFHTSSEEEGVMMASGSSPAVFEALIAMKDMDITPMSAMLEVLNSERYSKIQVG